jgi:hypothetical protein
MRVESETPMKNGGYLHKSDGEAVPYKPVKQPPRVTDTELSARFGPLARSWYVKQGEKAAELARLLGVAAWTTDVLWIGWDGSAWTIPERNHREQIIGIQRRLVSGRKICVLGSRRGLTYADDWLDYPGPVFLVEGASDVAAGLTLGLCVVGRPSNIGGVEYLVKLLGKRAADRRIIVVGERDEKDRMALVRHKAECRCCGQCFPGMYGAKTVAARLAQRLERLIPWALPPAPHKDLRGWLNSHKADPEDEKTMLRIGKVFSHRMVREAKA